MRGLCICKMLEAQDQATTSEEVVQALWRSGDPANGARASQYGVAIVVAGFDPKTKQRKWCLEIEATTVLQRAEVLAAFRTGTGEFGVEMRQPSSYRNKRRDGGCRKDLQLGRWREKEGRLGNWSSAARDSSIVDGDIHVSSGNTHDREFSIERSHSQSNDPKGVASFDGYSCVGLKMRAKNVAIRLRNWTGNSQRRSGVLIGCKNSSN